MTIRYRLITIAAFVLSLVALPACYTLLNHPRVASLEYARPENKRCADCHTAQQMWSFNHSPAKPGHDSYSRAWLVYYETAWWYERVWHYQPHETDPARTSPETGGDEG